VNNGILKDQYLEETISVQYPTVDNLIDLKKKKGKGCQTGSYEPEMKGR
jgi:hypothetical protein